MSDDSVTSDQCCRPESDRRESVCGLYLAARFSAGAAVGGRRAADGGLRTAVGGRRSAVGGRRSAFITVDEPEPTLNVLTVLIYHGDQQLTSTGDENMAIKNPKIGQL